MYLLLIINNPHTTILLVTIRKGSKDKIVHFLSLFTDCLAKRALELSIITCYISKSGLCVIISLLIPTNLILFWFVCIMTFTLNYTNTYYAKIGYNNAFLSSFRHS